MSLCGPFNQNLAWHEATGQLVCIQNVIAGRGWRLDYLNLAKAIKAGTASAEGVRARQLTFPPHTELEGFLQLSNNRAVFVTAHSHDFVTAHSHDNAAVGRIKSIAETASPAQTSAVSLP